MKTLQNEAREIDYLSCKEREVDSVLIDLAKIPQCNRRISPFSFYDNCLTTSHASYPYLPCKWIHLFVPGVNEGNDNAGWIESFIFFVSCGNQGGLSPRFPSVTPGEGGKGGRGDVSSNLLWEGWFNLACGGVCRW